MNLLRLDFGSRATPTRLTLGYLQLKPLSAAIKDGLKELDLPQGAVVVDFGCGNMPYRGLFDSQVLYLGLDFPPQETCAIPITGNTVFANIESSPVKQECADLVLCTQVLEHVAEPAAVISEIERILKVGGTVILSTHGVFPVHAFPNDFWRWTDSGLRKMFEKFCNVRVIATDTTIGTFAYLLEDQIYFHFSPPVKSIRGMCGLALRWIINIAGDVAQRIRPIDSGKRPLIGVYVVVAKKKERA